MDEHDMRALGREPLGPAGRPRAVGDVMRRGRRLRRRATAVRTAPLALGVVVLAIAGVLALSGGSQGDVDVASGPGGGDLPVKEEFCNEPEPEPVPAEQLDGLRLMPTTLPAGVEVAAAEPRRHVRGTCVDVDPALVLRAVAGDGQVDAEIVLEGPFGEPYGGGDEVALEPTRLRGRPASRTYNPTDPGSYVGFTWTEPDGTSWLLPGDGVDEATLRAVAEGLELRGSPADGEPAAALPDDAVPEGWEVTWQAPGLPAVEGPAQTEWVVRTTPPWTPYSSRPTGCEITIATTAREAPPGRLWAGDRGRQVEVRGRPGFAVEANGAVVLDWQEAPGVVGHLLCVGDIATAVRVADSLIEVAPDDPRIVPTGGG